jgi:hypothetical protein
LQLFCVEAEQLVTGGKPVKEVVPMGEPEAALKPFCWPPKLTPEQFWKETIVTREMRATTDDQIFALIRFTLISIFSHYLLQA